MGQVLVHEYGCWTSSRFLIVWYVVRMAGVQQGHGGIWHGGKGIGGLGGYGDLGGIGWQAGREAWAWGFRIILA
eukprot:jgi/Botrbrau1/5123/Bobra.0128s0031.1